MTCTLLHSIHFAFHVNPLSHHNYLDGRLLRDCLVILCHKSKGIQEVQKKHVTSYENKCIFVALTHAKLLSVVPHLSPLWHNLTAQGPLKHSISYHQPAFHTAHLLDLQIGWIFITLQWHLWWHYMIIISSQIINSTGAQRLVQANNKGIPGLHYWPFGGKNFILSFFSFQDILLHATQVIVQLDLTTVWFT